MIIRKDERVEALRGLAILLLVAGHVVGADGESGLRVDDRSLYRYFYFSTQFLRLPLFTVVSGFVYSLRPLSPGSFSFLVRGKARRILIPLLFVSTLQYLARGIVSDVNHPVELNKIWRIYFFPFDHFWFLQSIFLVFLTVAILDNFKVLASHRGWIVCFLCSVALMLGCPRFTGLFGFVGYLYLLPYFLLGCGICRFPIWFRSYRVTVASLVSVTLAVSAQQFVWFQNLDVDQDRASVSALAIGVPAGILLVSYRFHNDWLAKLGFYSYGIYLFHVFGTAGCRIFLTRAGVEATLFIFAASLFVGLAWPVLLEALVLTHRPLLRFLCFGQRTRPIRPAVATLARGVAVTGETIERVHNS